jgi:hypothetical protein
MWPPCSGVSGLPVARTPGANRIRPACRYAADEDRRSLNRVQGYAAIHELSRSARILTSFVGQYWQFVVVPRKDQELRFGPLDIPIFQALPAI